MLIYFEDGQASLFAQDSSAGKMSQGRSPAVNRRAKISESFSKRSSELSSIPYMFLDLTPGAGNLLGELYWEILSPWRGDALMLNTGVSPREGKESSLWQILEERPHPRYYLTRKACLGILRRSSERGKELPTQLKDALETQSGIRRGDSAQQITGNGPEAASQLPVAIDSKHACATGDIANTLSTNCGSPTGRNGVMAPIAFAQNQRDEVRDLHDVAGALAAQPGMKQQTYIAAPSGPIEEIEKPILCLNDQVGNLCI